MGTLIHLTPYYINSKIGDKGYEGSYTFNKNLYKHYLQGVNFDNLTHILTVRPCLSN